MLPSHIRAVFFDAVGTLIHPAPGAPRVYAGYAARHGLAADEGEVRRRMTAAYFDEERADEAAGWVTSEARERERWQRIVAASLPGADCFDELFAHFARPNAWTVDPNAGPLLATLVSRGLTVGMGSNYDARLKEVVAGSPALAPVRGKLVISSLVGVRKPGAGFFAAVEAAAGCRADEIAFVGDDPGNDYDGATAAGMWAVLLDDPDRHPGTRRVRRLADLLT
jgi:putative hydrolase of the HAD superfamily